MVEHTDGLNLKLDYVTFALTAILRHCVLPSILPCQYQAIDVQTLVQSNKYVAEADRYALHFSRAQ